MRGDDFKLCFVDRDQTAYFTSKPLAEAGDASWDGPLSRARPPADEPPGTVVSCAFDGSGVVLAWGRVAESTSAAVVNGRNVPWAMFVDADIASTPLAPGTTFREFRRLIRKAGGKTWVDSDYVDGEGA